MEWVKVIQYWQSKNLFKSTLWAVGLAVCARKVLGYYGAYMSECGMLGVLEQAEKAGVLETVAAEFIANMRGTN